MLAIAGLFMHFELFLVLAMGALLFASSLLTEQVFRWFLGAEDRWSEGLFWVFVVLAAASLGGAAAFYFLAEDIGSAGVLIGCSLYALRAATIGEDDGK